MDAAYGRRFRPWKDIFGLILMLLTIARERGVHGGSVGITATANLSDPFIAGAARLVDTPLKASQVYK
jgi:hypothetical protein